MPNTWSNRRRGIAFAAAAAAAALFVPAASAERPARVSSGLAFAITLTNGGKAISNDRISLRVPGTKGALIVSLESWDLSGGRFSTPLTLENRTDADLYALRVDLLSTSSVKSRVAGGSPAPDTDRRGTSAPLTWDALAKNARSTSLPFTAPDVVFGADTTLVTVLGAATGVASLGWRTVQGEEGATAAVRLDLDGSGNLILTDVSGKAYRAAPDGTGARELRGSTAPAGKPAAPRACAAGAPSARKCRETPDDPVSVWALGADGEEISQLDAAGAVVRSFRLPGGPILDLAPGKEGRVYLLRRGGTIGVLRSF